MARRSVRLSVATSPATKHKRAASGSSVTGTATKKTKNQQATPTKSQYFEPENDQPQDSTSAGSDSGSDFQGHDDDDEDVKSELGDVSDDDDEDDDATPRKAKSSKPSNGQVWKAGEKTGLGPGKQVIIKKPKARPAGKTPYVDEYIHPNTLLFLTDLKANNQRSWLKMQDAEFRQAEKDWFSFVEKMTERLIDIDDTIPELPVKDVIFRIYRDVRFSKDPTPYKPWFSVAWSRAGRKSAYAHYYVQISSGKSFVGGGLWHPEAAPTNAMRTAIDRSPRRLKDVLIDDRIRRHFLGGAQKSDAAAVKAFVKGNSDNALKTKPKGFDADHPDIDLLRLRNYTIGASLADDEILGERGMNRVAELLASMKPFITYLNSVVMPDEESDGNDGSQSDTENEEEGEEEEEGAMSDA